jgi:hypothetical protein
VKVAIGTRPSGGTLAGVTQLPLLSGVATFDNLHIDQPGTGYTLTATDTSSTGAIPQPATSAAFNITAASLPDLTIGALAATPANPTTADIVTLSAVVSNSGGSTAGPSHVNLCALHFFAPGSWTAHCTTVADHPSIPAGGSVPVSGIFVGFAAGTYTLVASVDTFNVVPESNETNNYTEGPSFVVSPWSPQSSGTANYLRGVWGTSGNNVFAVGADGTIRHYDGSTWGSQRRPDGWAAHPGPRRGSSLAFGGGRRVRGGDTISITMDLTGPTDELSVPPLSRLGHEWQRRIRGRGRHHHSPLRRGDMVDGYERDAGGPK